MSTSKSRYAYHDCYTLMEAAIADGTGTRYSVPSQEAGFALRLRLNAARQIDRDDNGETYEATHKMYRRSEFDVLRCTVERDGPQWWVYLRVNEFREDKMQGLSQLEEAQVEADETHVEPDLVEMLGRPELGPSFRRRF